MQMMQCNLDNAQKEIAEIEKQKEHICVPKAGRCHSCSSRDEEQSKQRYLRKLYMKIG